jgi:TatD DNase family protein
MPLEFLLLETDSPDQPLHGHQGARNEPSRLVEVCECVAQLRGVDAGVIARATSENANRLFCLPVKRVRRKEKSRHSRESGNPS